MVTHDIFAHMGNTWFRFKQFTVHQQHAAMKVTTDACLFGAMLPRLQPSDGIEILDIGTGTGLLSLMAAQLNPGAAITGLEIDAATTEEARQNVALSPFKNQINIIQTDVLDYKPAQKFHHIFSNPPFYEDQLASPCGKRNTAHHSSRLTIGSLIPLIRLWLLPGGTAAMLVPFYREQEIIETAAANELFPMAIIRVRQSPRHHYFRCILHFQQQNHPPHVTEITIRDAQNQYTDAFVALLRPFYLNL